jgi:tetratricopeptide (TPR) repeat protein
MKRLLAIWRIVGAVAVLSSIITCGDNAPLNSVFTTGDDKTRVDYILAKAQAHLDNGNFDSAQNLAERALAINAHNETAAQLLGFALLARAGLSPFEMAEKLIDVAESSASGTTGILFALSPIAETEASDFDVIGTRDHSNLAIFEDFDVYTPNLPGSLEDPNSPRNQVHVLHTTNRIIEAICPFVDPNALQPDVDNRHVCDFSFARKDAPTQSLFLWALAHLVEALALNKVLMFRDDLIDPNATEATSNDTSSLNLFKRVTALQASQSQLSITDFVTAVTTVQNNILSIYDDAEGSLLFTVMTDLTAVLKAFQAIDGIPDSVVASLRSVIDSINTQASQIGENSDTVSGQATGFRDQLINAMSSNMAENVDQYISDNDLDAANATQEQIDAKNTLCEALSSVETAGVSLPNACS